MTCSWVLCVLRRGFAPSATAAAIAERSAGGLKSELGGKARYAGATICDRWKKAVQA